jgi:hypothetical protein
LRFLHIWLSSSEESDQEKIAHKIWTKTESGRLLRSTITLPIGEAIKELFHSLTVFAHHYQVKVFQHKAYRMNEASATLLKIISQVDFTENFSFSSKTKLRLPIGDILR